MVRVWLRLIQCHGARSPAAPPFLIESYVTNKTSALRGFQNDVDKQLRGRTELDHAVRLASAALATEQKCYMCERAVDDNELQGVQSALARHADATNAQKELNKPLAALSVRAVLREGWGGLDPL